MYHHSYWKIFQQPSKTGYKFYEITKVYVIFLLRMRDILEIAREGSSRNETRCDRKGKHELGVT